MHNDKSAQKVIIVAIESITFSLLDKTEGVNVDICASGIFMT